MDANYDTVMLELSLNNQVMFDTDETKEEQESFLFHEKDSDDIPPSLLSYFETSKSRAAVCEKLILEEIEDFTASHHTDGLMNLPFELHKDMRKPNEKVNCDTENEENNTDARLLPAPTEPLFTHNVSVCPNDEDGTDEYMESEKHFAFEYEAEQEKRHCEKKEEERRQIERDFQKELKKIMEEEKLHQKEFELMGKRAQQKLEQELLLQQELISNLQRRVEEERRTREEEQRRIKEEEDKRKRKEEKIKIEAERKRMEEETRRKKEEERKIDEITLKKEEERKHKEEEKKRMEREEKRKREEERMEIDLEKKNLEDGLRMTKEKEERKREEEKRKKEKERKETEEAREKMEKEKRKMEEEMSLKKEEEESKKSNKENMRIQEEVRTMELEERKKQDEMRTNNEEQEADDGKKMAQEKLNEEMRRRGKSKHGNADEEIKFVERKKKDGGKMEEKREVKEMVREQEGKKRKHKEELGPIEEDEERKTDYEKKTKEEEQKRKQRDEVYSRIRLKEDQEGCKGSDLYNRKLEHESKTKEKKQDETSKREEEIKNVEGEKQLKGKFMGETKKEVPEKTEEEIRLKVKEGSQKRVVQDREKDVRANELQEKRENNSMNKDETENSLVSQLQDSTTWTSSSPGPSHSESTVRPTSTETVPQQHDPEETISQTSIDKTVDCENQAARPSPVFLPVCLPVHTENKRLSWMKDCIPWSKLSLQNKRKQKGSVRSRRGLRGAAEAGSLPPLCPDTLLQFTGRKSLQVMTTVTLEDLPGCSLTTLAQCTQLQSLTLRRCGLKSLEGINQIPQLCYIDVQENDISFVNCENMTSLRVLQLGHNKLTSIHGLTGAENLDVLDLSHNSITRIAGLESMRRLQRLSLDHNQLISTKGLRDVFTLLHLNCSHNHLASVEGLENSALLNTLDLRANSLTEPPSLNNQVLLRELHLDDNSISSLQGLTACWLPLMQHLSVAQNRITQLPSMTDSVSLANLDLRFNCMSELQNVCYSLEGCPSLREVHLTGNPLQQESGWRSTLQKAVPGLRAIDDQDTDSFLPPRAVQQVSLAPGSFLAFCQAQLQQTGDLQQQHSRELSNASSSLDAVKTSCRHFAEALQLAMDQRFAHEYGDTTVATKHRAASQPKPEERLGHMDSTNAEKCTKCPEMESTEKVQPVLSNKDNIRYKYWTFEEKLAAESRHYSFETVARGPKTEPTICRAYSGSVHSSATKGKPTSSNNKMAPVSNHQDLDLQNTAAVVIQQLWRKYRLKCENISSLSTAEKGGGSGGDGGKPESGPGSIVGQDYAATVIQAFWRGFTLRRRLASALAAVTCPDTGEDDTFEEVDMDECVFDEAALEIDWTLSLTEDPPPRRYPVSEQPLSLKPPGHFPEPSQYILPPPLVLRPKQAWVPEEKVDSAGQRLSPESPIRGKSPASTSMLSGLSERSEKILEEWGFTDSHTALLMLKRAQKMKSTKQQQKKRRDPSVRLALFRNCSPQLGPVEARNMPAQHNRNYLRVGVAELGLQQAEMVERVTQERAEQWLRTQAAHSDRDSESEHFLPEISSDILNGGRVQLVADPGYTERLHQANGLWANSSLAAQPCQENNYPRRNSLGRARKEVPSPQRVTSAPSKKERISYRDNPVQLSGGWGGGKKRDKVYK